MDHYPEVINVQDRERVSRLDSDDSLKKASLQHILDDKTPDGSPALLKYAMLPPPSQRNDSGTSTASTPDEDGARSAGIDAEWAQYTDAPPSFSEQQYEGKSEVQQNDMRRADYAKEIQRMMGKQLVKDLKSGETKDESHDY
jgi:hypothetical protein